MMPSCPRPWRRTLAALCREVCGAVPDCQDCHPRCCLPIPQQIVPKIAAGSGAGGIKALVIECQSAPA